MNRKNTLRHALGAALAASMLAAGGSALAQADNTNSATDPTYYGSWFWWNPAQDTRYWRHDIDATPRVYVYGPAVTYTGPAYYESWRYYDPPVTFYTYPSATPLGVVTEPGYMGPRDVTP